MFSWKRKHDHKDDVPDGTRQDSEQGAAASSPKDDSKAGSDGDGSLRRLHLKFVGQVQGVGFRWTAQHTARDLGLTGWVLNAWDGSVVMELQGTNQQISEFFGEFAQQWRGPYAISYTIDEKEDIEPDPHEATFSVRY